MLSKTDRQIAREFRHCLEAIAPLLDLRMLGLRARGDARPTAWGPTRSFWTCSGKVSGYEARTA